MARGRQPADAGRVSPPEAADPGRAAAYAQACCTHDHVVAFYDTDAYLTEIVSAFLGEGLAGGGAAVIVAAPGHRDGICGALAAQGIDLAHEERSGRLVVLDAAETLARFMTPDGPHAGHFEEVIGGVLRRAAGGGTELRVYGEMVALLWAGGAVAAAIALEDLWNDLAGTIDFTLLCAYPMSAFTDPASGDAFARVCEQHGGLIPAEGYDLLDEEQRRRHHAALDREVRVLRALVPGEASAAPGTVGPHAAAATDATAAFTSALLAADARAATQILREALGEGEEPRRLIDRVLTPAMHQVGQGWAAGQLSIADEHLATVTCQRALTDLYPSLLSERPRSRGCVIVAGVEGELHAIAPRVVGDVLEGAGYDVIHLGTNVAASTLAETAVRVNASLVALSLTLGTNAASLRRAIAALQDASPACPLLLGGQGVDDFADLGFPVARSVEDAVELAEHLITHRPPMPSVEAEAALPHTADRAAPGAAERFAAVADELSDLARAHALRAHEYQFQAMQDQLTGLPNRRAFDDRFERMERSGVSGALLIVDIDEFKTINDTLGHEAGDEVLKRVGRTLAAAVRPGDLIARLGGDEFAALLARGEEPADPAEIAERLRADVQVACADLDVTVSVGAATFRTDRRLTALAADRALYRAKNAGRNSTAVAVDG